jgi:RNA polymerase sigma factor (sigma-70 family)
MIDYYRQPKTISLEVIDDIPDEITQYQKFDKKRNAEILWQAIQSLSSNEKNILLLRYKDNLPIKRIAQIVGKSENAVKIALTRIRKKLSNHPYLKTIACFNDYEKQYTYPKFLKQKK